MKVNDLVEKLKTVDGNLHIYINYDANWLDDFEVGYADTDNLVLVPNANFIQLKDNQLFDIKKI